LNLKCFFGNISLWIRSHATICVVFEDDYEIKYGYYEWKKGT